MEKKVCRWLSPKEASELLGVHPTTLRIWTNQGKLPAYRTAGGHRRFDEAIVLRFLEQSKELQAQNEISYVVEKGLIHTRGRVSQHLAPREQWYSQLDDSARSQHQVLGRQMLGLMVQYVARDNSHARLLDEGRRLAREIACQNLQMGLSLSEIVRAFVFFRDSLVDSLVPALMAPGNMDSDDLRIHRRAREFLNEMLTVMLEVIEADQGKGSQ